MFETQKPGFHREQIKAMIRMRGSTLVRISTDAGMPHTSASAGLFRPFPKANRVIAAFLGLSLHDLWPDWYDRDGLRIRAKRSPACKSSDSGDKSHAKNSKIHTDGRGAHV